MLYVYTLWDKARDSRPLITGAYDSTAKSLKIFVLYLRNTTKSIYDIEQTAAELKELMSKAGTVMLNDYKQHLIAFNLDHESIGKVFDVELSEEVGCKDDIKSIRRGIATILSKMCSIKPQYWHLARANAAVVYSCLQRRGVLYGYELKYPTWGRVYSGRSKSTGFNVQGLGQDHLTGINNHKVFLNFDWVSADMRAIATMSGDEKLNTAFMHSDPYQELADYINVGVDEDKLTRDEAKRLMFKSVYSLGSDNPALDYYSGFGDWITMCRSKLEENGHLKSMLGRKFRISETRTERSVFNATIQGSVAHAMQICLRRVWDMFPDNILTENHDSLTMVCDPDDTRYMINEIAKIMIQPFNGILKNNPQFPLKISVGSGYKNWKSYKRYNYCEQIT